MNWSVTSVQVLTEKKTFGTRWFRYYIWKQRNLWTVWRAGLGSYDNISCECAKSAEQENVEVLKEANNKNIGKLWWDA